MSTSLILSGVSCCCLPPPKTPICLLLFLHLLFLVSFVGGRLTFSSSIRPFLPPCSSRQCQFPPFSPGSVPGAQTCVGEGLRPYANESTLCKSAPSLIKSQLQIQLADWTDREVCKYPWDDGWKEKFPKRREGSKNKEITAEGVWGKMGCKQTKQNKKRDKYQILLE